MTKDEAIEIMRSVGSRSIPYLQRHLKVSYEEAFEIFEYLDASKKREHEKCIIMQKS